MDVQSLALAQAAKTRWSWDSNRKGVDPVSLLLTIGVQPLQRQGHTSEMQGAGQDPQKDLIKILNSWPPSWKTTSHGQIRVHLL